MPQLIILAAVGLGAYAGYRWVRAKGREAVLKASRAAARPAASAGMPSDRARNAGDLVWDEEKGVYRPRT